MLKLHFYSDPGHGWLRVPEAVLDLFVGEWYPSRYSYVDTDEEAVYLEADSDASAFLNLVRAKDIEVAITDHYDDHTHIRDLPRYRNAEEEGV